MPIFFCTREVSGEKSTIALLEYLASTSHRTLQYPKQPFALLNTVLQRYNTVPYGFDTTVGSIYSKSSAHKTLNIPRDKIQRERERVRSLES